MVQVINAGRGSGSGFLISSTEILSAAHVVGDSDTPIQVRFASGLVRPATRIGSDEESDVSLLRIQAVACSPLRLCENEVDLGAIGRPIRAVGFAPKLTTSSGIIAGRLGDPELSDVGVSHVGPAHYGFVSLDLSTYSGMSGGPLLATSGCAAGMVLASGALNFRPSFAAPARSLREVLHQLRKNGRVLRGFLGVETEAVALSEQSVALRVRAVVPNGPASLAELEVGSDIRSISDVQIHSLAELRGNVAFNGPGPIKLTAYKGGSVRSLNVVLAPYVRGQSDKYF
ncbi:MAG: S1C family serine protease [Polyangiaceae bacterium]